MRNGAQQQVDELRIGDVEPAEQSPEGALQTGRVRRRSCAKSPYRRAAGCWPARRSRPAGRRRDASCARTTSRRWRRRAGRSTARLRTRGGRCALRQAKTEHGKSGQGDKAQRAELAERGQAQEQADEQEVATHACDGPAALLGCPSGTTSATSRHSTRRGQRVDRVVIGRGGADEEELGNEGEDGRAGAAPAVRPGWAQPRGSLPTT